MIKRNDWIFLATLTAYSFLFWQQEPGLNFLLMTCILIGGLILRDKSVIRSRYWIITASSAVIASFCVAWYGNALSVIANFTALVITAAFSLHRNNSLFAAWLLGLLNGVTAAAFIIIAFAERAGNMGGNREAPKTKLKKLMLLGAVAVVGIIFFCLYRGSSVLFESLTDQIDFSFISVFWCVFMIAGAVALFGFYRQQKFELISVWDRNLPMNLEAKERTGLFDRLMSLDSEYFTGIALFGLLNFLLLIVNGLDVAFLVGGTECLPKDVTYSQYVHQGINTLILSILFATALILVWFRNYHSANPSYRKIRLLVLLWIFQNMFMIAITILRNHDYIFVYGITYKRIGVDVYLLLALAGLALVFRKIVQQKSNAFVSKYFGWVCFGVLIAATPVNWDRIVFSYNSKLQHRLDMMYANSLSYISLPDQHKYKTGNYVLTPREYSELQSKTFEFLSHHRYLHENGMWQSYNLATTAVYDELITMNLAKDSVVHAGKSESGSIYFFPCYAEITGLTFFSSDLTSIGEVSEYQQLRALDLRYNEELKSISGIEKCVNLQEIDLRGTHVTSYAPLMLMPQLRVLYVDYLDAETEDNLRTLNPNLSIQH